MQAGTLNNIFEKFERWIIVRLREDVGDAGRNHYLSFVAFSVIIDNLASIRYLGEFPDTPNKSQVGTRYQKFIKEYMPPKYKGLAGELYKGFRCKLVHKFQLKGFDIRQTAESRKLHLQKVEDSNTCLNVQEFFNDLVSAFNKLKDDMIGRNANSDIVKSFCKTDYRKWKHTG